MVSPRKMAIKRIQNHNIESQNDKNSLKFQNTTSLKVKKKEKLELGMLIDKTKFY